MKNLFFSCILIASSLSVYAQQNNASGRLTVSTVTMPETPSTTQIAADSIPQFLTRIIDSMKAPKGMFEKFAVEAKADLIKNGVHEQLWALLIDYEDEHFVGILSQRPSKLKDLVSGQQVRFKKEAVKEIIIKNVRTGVQTNYHLGKPN